MIADFTEALNRISEVVMFENWLRFYFISEEDEKLFIRIPEQAMGKLRDKYPGLAGLAEELNNTEVDHKSSLAAVCLFVANDLEGITLNESTIGQVLDSPRFHLELQLFGFWVQSHEEQLDEAFIEFSVWQEEYRAWKRTDKVKEFAESLALSFQRNVRATTETTQ